MGALTRTDFGLFGEQRLVLEPAFLAVILAGGLGAFIHYDMSEGAQISEASALIAAPVIKQKMLSSAASFAPAMPVRLSFGAKPAQASQTPQITTATLLRDPPAKSGSFLSHLNGSAAKQDYVIRLTFPEPAAADLAVVAAPSPHDSAALARDVLALTEPAAPSPALVQHGIATDAMGAPEPAAMAELRPTVTPELQLATGPATVLLDGLKFDLAALPDNTRPKAAASVGPGSQSLAPSVLKRDRLVGAFIFHQAGVQLNDSPAGPVDVRIGGDTSLSIQVSALLAIVEGHMDPALFAALSASAGAEEYVSFREIRDAGIDVRYDAAADRIVFTAD